MILRINNVFIALTDGDIIAIGIERPSGGGTTTFVTQLGLPVDYPVSSIVI